MLPATFVLDVNPVTMAARRLQARDILEVTGQTSAARPVAYGNGAWSCPDRDGWGPDPCQTHAGMSPPAARQIIHAVRSGDAHAAWRARAQARLAEMNQLIAQGRGDAIVDGGGCTDPGGGIVPTRHTAREMAAILRRALSSETTGQTDSMTPPTGMICPAGMAPALLDGQWSCQRPLVETHPIVTVLIVAGFCVVFLGVLLLTFIFPG